MPDTPYSILDNQLSQLQDYYKDREQKLRIRRLPKAQHNAEVANMQSGYDAQKFRISSMRSQLDNIRESDVDPTLRDEAMWRLVVPSEQAAAMFPKKIREPAGRAPFSPQQLEGFHPSIKEFATAAEEIPGLEWGLPRRELSDLLKQYIGWREHFGYSDPKMTNTNRRQMDEEWDDIMAGEKWSRWNPKKKTGWNPNDPQVKALRTYGGRITGEAAKKISPLAKSIQASKPKGPVGIAYKTAAEAAEATLADIEKTYRVRSLDANTAREILRGAGGDKEKARQIARQRGYEL